MSWAIPKEANQEARQRADHASFGDEQGITASANAYGNLLQITRYFGNKPSGFFCAELCDIDSPDQVSNRLGTLSRHSTDPEKGSHLQFNDTVGNTEETAESQLTDDELAEWQDIWSRWPSRGRRFYDFYSKVPSLLVRNLTLLSLETPAMSFVHNRWPCFTAEPRQDYASQVQLLISSGTVYQTYTFKIPKDTVARVVPRIMINHTARIRDLNFAEDGGGLGGWLDDSGSDHKMLEGTNCFITTRRLAQCDAVALFLFPFVNGRPQQPRLRPQKYRFDADLLEITLDEESKELFFQSEQLRVTLAYKLEKIPVHAEGWESEYTAPRAEFEAANRILQLRSQLPPLNEEPHLNFVLWRNLEHVLSVCSIPIGDSSKPDALPSIALTCGDICSHRVVTAASFYAFKFLLLVLERLKDIQRCTCSEEKRCPEEKEGSDEKESSKSVCRMRFRVWRVCHGHLKWLSLDLERINKYNTQAYRGNSDQVGNEERKRRWLAPHCWASGAAVQEWETQEQFSRWALVDTPFQILKAASVNQITKGTAMREEVARAFKGVITQWAQDLDAMNKDGQYAFPRSKDDFPLRFYLADHALIWWAMKSAEELNFVNAADILKLAIESEQATELYWEAVHKTEKHSISSKAIQANILKRFTTDNLISKTRMLAVSRTFKDTRFFFRLKDTVLFYAEGLGMFDKPGTRESSEGWRDKIDAWENTLECQKHHDECQDERWYQPLRFALSIILASNNRSVNSRKPEQMYEHAISVLLQSSSPNGLFPGQLGHYKDPVVFASDEETASYWYATFEVPYILLRYPRPQQRHEEREADSSATLNQPCASLPHGPRQYVSPAMEATMKQILPSISAIDQHNIVELPDAWLYNEPAFFNPRRCTPYYSDLQEFCRDNRENDLGTVMNRATRSVIDLEGSIQGVVVDISKPKWRSDQSKSEASREAVANNEEFSAYSLWETRSRLNAKKKMLQFCRANLTTLLICYFTSSEREELSEFFDRHASYDKYFFEDVTPDLNRWVTELHLSFWQILVQNVEAQNLKATDIHQRQRVNFPGSGSDPRWMTRAVMSFRFDGDFLDRYWTCHFFQYSPKAQAAREHESDILSLDVTPRARARAGEKDPWGQRKVLELILFDAMLQEMQKSAEEILKESKERVQNALLNGGERDQSKREATENGQSSLADTLYLLTDLNNDTFLSTSLLCHQIQHLLQAVEEDMDENLAKIEEWLRREKERGPDRPRWTRNDERRYRSTISKWQASNSRKVSELQRSHRNIISYNASLTRRLEEIRSELEVRGSEDIRLFTYVTVIFLPVGFATGVFSTSAAPSRATITGMAITAVVALLFTLVVLVNAKWVARKIVRPVKAELAGWLSHTGRNTERRRSVQLESKEDDISIVRGESNV